MDYEFILIFKKQGRKAYERTEGKSCYDKGGMEGIFFFPLVLWRSKAARTYRHVSREELPKRLIKMFHSQKKQFSTPLQEAELTLLAARNLEEIRWGMR